MILIYLKNYTKIFDELIGQFKNVMSRKSDWEIFVGALLMRHIGQLVCNGHAISGLRATLWTDDMSEKLTGLNPMIGSLRDFFKQSRMFTAFFPRISFLNHSCDPNIWNRY